MYYQDENRAVTAESKRIYDMLVSDLSNPVENQSLCEDYQLALHHIKSMEVEMEYLRAEIGKYKELIEVVKKIS